MKPKFTEEQTELIVKTINTFQLRTKKICQERMLNELRVALNHDDSYTALKVLEKTYLKELIETQKELLVLKQ